MRLPITSEASGHGVRDSLGVVAESGFSARQRTAPDSAECGDGMALVILLPALACVVAIAMGSTRSALINVYLPAVLLLPQSFELRFEHLPPLTFADAGGFLWAWLYCLMRRWRFDWMDLLVVLFAVSEAVSEGMSTALANGTWVRIFTSPAETIRLNGNNGIFQLVAGITMIVLPYMVGKLLIEGGKYNGEPVRVTIIRRMVTLLAIVAAISVFDFLTGRSTWQQFFKHFFPGQAWWAWPTQIRWGFGRIIGPFAHAILAGMMFLMGLIYCIWLRTFQPQCGGVFKEFRLTVRGAVMWAIVGGLLMTQSRGPWLGVMLALLFVFLVRKYIRGQGDGPHFS